ncbi:MAG: insulinase family protein [Bacteroidota bacterium]|nr:insulinase family protein [Bacteroidota bacterium]
MKKFSLVFTFLVILSQAFAQSYTFQTFPNDPYKIRKYTLSNGLTVFLGVNKKEPRVETMIAVKAGSKTDPSNNTGLAHYLEHLMFKGTENYGTVNYGLERDLIQAIEEHYAIYNSSKDSAFRKQIYKVIDSLSITASRFAIANEYDNMMQNLGASGTNAFTSDEMTVYINNVPSNNLDKWLNIEGERFRNPVFRLFHTELEAVYEEKNIGLDNDNRKAEEALMAGLFKIHPYGTQTTIGTVEHLKNPSLKAIRDYYNKNYCPNNMGIIMVGDIDPDATIKLIDKYFSYMKPGQIPPLKFPEDAYLSKPELKIVTGPDASFLKMGYRTPGAGTREAMILDLTAALLYNGTSGILELDLVKQQKVQSLTLSVNTLMDYSVMEIMAKPKTLSPGNELPIIIDMSREIYLSIQKIAKGEFDEKLIKSVLANKRVELMHKQLDSRSVSFDVLDAFVTEVEWSKYYSKLDEMGKVTKQEIVDFAKKYLGEGYVTVIKVRGTDTTIKKVDKPQITAVETNAGQQSDFTKKILEIPSPTISPVFAELKDKIMETKLKSGIQLSVVQNTKNELFNLTITWDIGKLNFKALPLALGYLKYLGTEKHSSEEMAKNFYDIACEYNFGATDRQTYINISGLNENFDKALSLVEDLFTNPKVDKEKYLEYLNIVRKTRIDNKQNKRLINQGLTNLALYGPINPFSFNLNHTELEKQTPEELLKLVKIIFNFRPHIDYYGPEKIKKIGKKIDKLHYTTGKFDSVPPPFRFMRVFLPQNKVLFVDYDMVQAELQWVRNSTPYDAQQTPIINMFNEYYGGGMGSVVFQTIRESKALAYSCYMVSRQPEYKDQHFYINAYIGTQADKMPEAINSMNELIKTMPETDQLLISAKASIMSQIESERYDEEDLLALKNKLTKLGLTEDSRKLIYEKIKELSFTDLQNYFKKEINIQGYTLCVVGSKNKIQMPELIKFGQITDVNLEMLFGY